MDQGRGEAKPETLPAPTDHGQCEWKWRGWFEKAHGNSENLPDSQFSSRSELCYFQ